MTGSHRQSPCQYARMRPENGSRPGVMARPSGRAPRSAGLPSGSVWSVSTSTAGLSERSRRSHPPGSANEGPASIGSSPLLPNRRSWWPVS